MTPAAGDSSSTTSIDFRFLGRQPVLDSKLNLYGYEILFRSGNDNIFSGEIETATRQVIDSYLSFIPDEGEEVIFINCTRDVLVDGLVTLLSSKSTVLEILETVEADPELLESCRKLKLQGYRFALDDFSPIGPSLPFLEIAEFIKVDFRASDLNERREIYALAKSCGAKLIAEKVETMAEMKIALAEGCELFQGYFFSRPVILSQRAVPRNQLNYLMILAILSEEDPDHMAIERLIYSEASLCYGLLRLVNSACFSAPSIVTSIGNAILIVGQTEIRKLVTVGIAGLIEGGSSQIVLRMALERAKFCELLAPTLNQQSSRLYLLGMLSLMDALLQIPMSKIVESLPIEDQMKDALAGKGGTMAIALECARCFETGDWTGCREQMMINSLTISELSGTYLNAVEWAKNVLK